ncbi:DUF2314 domain-containing protein [Hymenobacter sp. YC55]|uniref:DUF2314 domain-containing protein n=1 Tax=Hymenobacter sp. YC55 TaxID=3034019 RepID=UPI0023F94F77|nr:DUF2314 domain-containing protein [Hymenobacter sp. YC55]MDF7809806.1 DUF2314 domain-containing protein [Hymenobacter sp. YC55]
MRQLLRIQLMVFGVAASFLSGCDSSHEKVGWNNEKQMFFVVPDDPEMTIAMRNSRKTVGQFLTALTSGDTTAYNFGIKAGFPTDEGFKEHIWLSELSVNGDTIYGVVDNKPDYTKAVVLGQKVAIHKDSITDWNYTQNGKLIGGYSIRVIRSRMSSKEQAAFDQTTGWNFD